MSPQPRRSIHLPAPGTKRAVVIGAGSFGTAVAVLLARGGLRTTLQTRTAEQAERLLEDRENRILLGGVELPRELRVEPLESGLARADYVFLGVPSVGLAEVIARLQSTGLPERASVVSPGQGSRAARWGPPTVILTRRFGANRTACVGGPAHAREMVAEGAGLVAASTEQELATALAGVFARAGVVCEESNDPIGVELAGAAKNAAALASGATEAQGLNAAGAAAGHIFAEVWRSAEAQGARPESMIGLAGTGDLVATALAPQSRNRRASCWHRAWRPRRSPRAWDKRWRRSSRSVAGEGPDSGRYRGAGHRGARTVDIWRAAAGAVGRGRSDDGAAAGTVAANRPQRVLAARARADSRLVDESPGKRQRDVYEP